MIREAVDTFEPFSLVLPTSSIVQSTQSLLQWKMASTGCRTSVQLRVPDPSPRSTARWRIQRREGSPLDPILLPLLPNEETGCDRVHESPRIDGCASRRGIMKGLLTLSESSKPDQLLASKNFMRCRTVSPRSRCRGCVLPVLTSSRTVPASASGTREALCESYQARS